MTRYYKHENPLVEVSEGDIVSFRQNSASKKRTQGTLLSVGNVVDMGCVAALDVPGFTSCLKQFKHLRFVSRKSS